MLSAHTTIYTLLVDYPFLTGFLTRRDRAFVRLRDPSSAARWARVATLGELTVEMDLPCPDLLREIQTEVLRVTGVAPTIAGATPVTSAEEGLAGDVRDLVRALEDGAPLDVLAARLDALIREAEPRRATSVAARSAPGTGSLGEPAMPVAPAGGLVGPSVPPHPDHPVAAVRRECVRLARLADLLEEVVGGIGDPPDPERLEGARAPLLGLIDRLRELDRQARRLRLAWYAPLSSRSGPSVATLTADRIDEALARLERLRVAVSGDEAAAVVAQAREGVALVRRALVTAEELLVPAADRVLDDDDWEAVAEQERLIGWALDSGQVP